MNDSDVRQTHPISRGELERRWAAVRARMRDAGVDALIVQGASNYAGIGGAFRWFTGQPPVGSYPQTVVFPRDALMTLVCHGSWHADSRLDDRDPALPGIGRRLCVPSFPAVSYCGGYDAELIARAVVESGARRLGLVAPQAMYHGVAGGLARLLDGVRIEDASDLVDPVKAVKSAEEIALIRRTAALQDDLLKKSLDHIRPGARDFEVMAYSHYLAALAGSETGYFLGSSAPPGQIAMLRHRPQQGRTLRPGDVFAWQAENTGPGGMFVHMGRFIVLGKAPQELVDAFGQMVEAQDFAARQLAPGADCRTLFAAYNTYMRGRGLPEETRLHCHGQGYDVVERPLIRQDETMALAAGMNIGLHPSIANARMFVTVCDNFLIGADGKAERLHHTPREIIEL